MIVIIGVLLYPLKCTRVSEMSVYERHIWRKCVRGIFFQEQQGHVRLYRLLVSPKDGANFQWKLEEAKENASLPLQPAPS